MTRTLSIAIKENTYQSLKEKVGLGKISSFVISSSRKKIERSNSDRKKRKRETETTTY